MISDELSKMKLKNEITTEQITNLQLNLEYLNALPKFTKKSIDTPLVSQKILEFLKN